MTMQTENLEVAASGQAEQKHRVEEAGVAIEEYQKSPAFAADLLRAFTAASEQARQENERLGISAQEVKDEPQAE